jgi:hypothetical protein
MVPCHSIRRIQTPLQCDRYECGEQCTATGKILPSNTSNASWTGAVNPYRLTRAVGDDIFFNLSHSLETTKLYEGVRQAEHRVNSLICVTQVLFNLLEDKLDGSSDKLAEFLNRSGVVLDFVVLATRDDSTARQAE